MNRILTILLAAGLFAVPTFAEAKLKLLKADVAKAEVLKLDATSGAMVPACCPARCVDYRHHRPCKKICCTCEPPIQTVLLVKDPCVCGCYVEVPVCVPGCCVGVPKVCAHDGFLGREVVEYEWCCGYRVKVVFDRRGDVTVHTYGV